MFMILFYISVLGLLLMFRWMEKACSEKTFVPVTFSPVTQTAKLQYLVFKKYNTVNTQNVNFGNIYNQSFLKNSTIDKTSNDHDQGVDRYRFLAAGILNVWDCGNAEYSALFGIGSPPQNISFAIDTGSSDLWVASSQCSSCPHNMQKFFESDSNTYKQSNEAVRLQYVDGSLARGTRASDHISISPTMVLTNQMFGDMTTVSLKLCGSFGGMMGLAFPDLSVIGGKTVLDNLFGSGILDDNVFGLYLANNQTGELVFGGSNADHYEGCLVEVPVIKTSSYWEVLIDQIGINNLVENSNPTTLFINNSVNLFPGSAWAGIIDSGCSLIMGPYIEVAEIFSSYGCECVYWDTEYQQYFFIDCIAGGNTNKLDFGLLKCPNGVSEVKPLYFQMNKKYFELQTSDIMILMEGTEFCVLAISAYDSPTWILGDPFMRAFYSVFDYRNKRLFFARATAQRTSPLCEAHYTNSSKNGSNISTIKSTTMLTQSMQTIRPTRSYRPLQTTFTSTDAIQHAKTMNPTSQTAGIASKFAQNQTHSQIQRISKSTFKSTSRILLPTTSNPTFKSTVLNLRMLTNPSNSITQKHTLQITLQPTSSIPKRKMTLNPSPESQRVIVQLTQTVIPQTETPQQTRNLPNQELTISPHYSGTKFTVVPTLKQTFSMKATASPTNLTSVISDFIVRGGLCAELAKDNSRSRTFSTVLATLTKTNISSIVLTITSATLCSGNRRIRRLSRAFTSSTVQFQIVGLPMEQALQICNSFPVLISDGVLLRDLNRATMIAKSVHLTWINFVRSTYLPNVSSTSTIKSSPASTETSSHLGEPVTIVLVLVIGVLCIGIMMCCYRNKCISCPSKVNSDTYDDQQTRVNTPEGSLHCSPNKEHFGGRLEGDAYEQTQTGANIQKIINDSDSDRDNFTELEIFRWGATDINVAEGPCHPSKSSLYTCDDQQVRVRTEEERSPCSKSNIENAGDCSNTEVLIELEISTGAPASFSAMRSLPPFKSKRNSFNGGQTSAVTTLPPFKSKPYSFKDGQTSDVRCLPSFKSKPYSFDDDHTRLDIPCCKSITKNFRERFEEHTYQHTQTGPNNEKVRDDSCSSTDNFTELEVCNRIATSFSSAVRGLPPFKSKPYTYGDQHTKVRTEKVESLRFKSNTENFGKGFKEDTSQPSQTRVNTEQVSHDSNPNTDDFIELEYLTALEKW